MKTKSQMKAVTNIVILLLLIITLATCNNNNKRVLSVNHELKEEVYRKLIHYINREDTVFKFENLGTGSSDSLLLFPSYTSLSRIQSKIIDYQIDDYSDVDFLDRNESLIIFSKKGTPLFYISLDSMFKISDVQRNSYSIGTTFILKPFIKTNGDRGAYLIPMRD